MYWQYGGGYPAYVSVAEKKRKAEKAAAKLVKSGQSLSPIRIEGRKIAASFWGKAWCEHLESFSDYENRLPRGRSYVRNGSVLDLKVEKGRVNALVQGSSLYKVTIGIAALSSGKWDALRARCAGEIGSVVELLQGRLSASVMKTVADREQGLFPAPREITLQCSCPDWADMCKHVAAALYGIGARLDKEPELLFVLRNVDHRELIDDAALPGKTVRAGAAQKTLVGQDLSVLFGIDVEEVPQGKKAEKTAPARKKTTEKIAGMRRGPQPLPKSQSPTSAERAKKPAAAKATIRPRVKRSTKNKVKTAKKSRQKPISSRKSV
ncbi:MAG: SWIM zinc finger family protein [Pseudomonadota bacterium]